MAELTASSDDGLEISQETPPSGPVNIENTYRPVAAFITKSDSQVISNLESAPSAFENLQLAPIPDPFAAITVDPVDGTITNVSGSFLIMGGNIAVQPSKGGGSVARLEISSETAFDGVNFVNTDFSLRNFEIPNDGESFLPSPAALLLPPGAKTRFLIWNAGAGTVTLTPPTANPNGSPVTGASVSLILNGYTFPFTP